MKPYGEARRSNNDMSVISKKRTRQTGKKEIERQFEEEAYPKDLGFEIEEMFEKLTTNMEDCPPEFVKVVDDHFWELV